MIPEGQAWLMGCRRASSSPSEIVEHANHAEALRLMNADLFIDQLEDRSARWLAEIRSDGKAKAVWDD
jgi:hypothetical protein